MNGLDRALLIACIMAALLAGGTRARAATSSPLFARGYTVVPEPQQAQFKGPDFHFGSGWRLVLGNGVEANGAAVESLRDGLTQRFGVAFSSGAGGKTIELAIRPGSVEIGQAQDSDRAALASQAYRLELGPGAIRITANAPAGLLYGVDTLVQLVKRSGSVLWLPAAEITDWPDLELRTIYWDDNHHLDRIDVLKTALRRAAFYKINGFAIKLNGHFDYASAPALVEPYALSPAQLQDLTNYGLRYHVQLIPYLDGPAHIAFILKHPEYAKLREFPDSNYELCTTNPDSYKLLDGMYHDLLNANRGVKYFVLSTDEPYYVGLAHNSQCDEAALTQQLGSVGKVLARFVTKAGGYLRDHGRTVIFWGEYPMKPSDIPSLPSWVVNGEVYGPEFNAALKAHGIRQMIYVSTEGDEPMFPSYFDLPPSQLFNPLREGHELQGMFRHISFDSSRQQSDLIGVFVAGWGDEGLHPTTFWLGYATGASWGWRPASPSPLEAMSSFFRLFYGPGATDMGRIYQLMSTQAEFWNSSWDTEPSQARKPIFGNSYGIFNPRRPARDQTLPLPPVPQGEYLRLGYDWGKANARRLELAQESILKNDELEALLRENAASVAFNRYNLQVFLSIAGLYRQNLQMIDELGEIDDSLKGAEAAAAEVRFAGAVAELDRALDLAESIRDQRNQAMNGAVQTWYESWFPRVAQANGRRYLNAIDDVKDHLPGRTVDMSYLVYRETLLPFGKWFDQVQSARNQYAQAHGLPVKTRTFDWKDTAQAAPADPVWKWGSSTLRRRNHY
ncbi:MAG: glycoside hydrolase family 20 zincin-like fold domain-containing protein [Terriglobia bacterium]